MARVRRDNEKPPVRGKMSAYNFFVKMCYDEHKKKYPTENVQLVEVSKKCAEKWKTMTGDEKRRFIELAQKDAERYAQEMAAYGGVDANRKRKRAKKDPNAPKRPLSAFFFFSQEKRQAIQQAHQDWKIGQVAQELGRMWKLLSEEDKKIYANMHTIDKARYENDMRNYKAGVDAPSHSGMRQPQRHAVSTHPQQVQVVPVPIPDKLVEMLNRLVFKYVTDAKDKRSLSLVSKRFRRLLYTRDSWCHITKLVVAPCEQHAPTARLFDSQTIKLSNLPQADDPTPHELLSLLQLCVHVKHLKLTCSCYRDHGFSHAVAARLAEMLQSGLLPLPQLKTFTLSVCVTCKNEMEFEAVQCAVSTVMARVDVLNLDIYGPTLSFQSGSSMVTLLQPYLNKLKQLHISDSAQDQIGDIFDALMTQPPNCLTHLDLALGESDMQRWGDFMNKMNPGTINALTLELKDGVIDVRRQVFGAIHNDTEMFAKLKDLSITFSVEQVAHDTSIADGADLVSLCSLLASYPLLSNISIQGDGLRYVEMSMTEFTTLINLFVDSLTDRGDEVVLNLSYFYLMGLGHPRVIEFENLLPSINRDGILSALHAQFGDRFNADTFVVDEENPDDSSNNNVSISFKVGNQKFVFEFYNDQLPMYIEEYAFIMGLNIADLVDSSGDESEPMPDYDGEDNNH